MLKHNPDWEYPHKKSATAIRDGSLGGTAVEGDPDSWYPEMWTWLIQSNGFRNMLDVGCGCGYAMDFFRKNGVEATGIEGSDKVLEHHLIHKVEGSVSTPMWVIKHNLDDEPFISEHQFDFVWCCEVAEHILPQYVDHVVQTVVQNTKHLLGFCAAPVGAGGYHHVNCQDPQYWIEKIGKAGLTYDERMTVQMQQMCGPHYGRGPRNYFTRSGLIFRRV